MIKRHLSNRTSSIISLSFAIALIPALIFLIREVRLMPGEISLKGSDRTKAVFCNLGFWYAAITLIGSFATNFILS